MKTTFFFCGFRYTGLSTDETLLRAALIKKHGKTDDGSKFAGTLIGKCNDHGDILVEGGEFPSVKSWAEKMRASSQRAPDSTEKAKENGEDGSESRPASSGLSSLGDRSIADYDEMMESL